MGDSTYTFQSVWHLNAPPDDRVLERLVDSPLWWREVLRKLEPIARPAFKANHRSMMKHGEQGLRTFLAGYRTKLH
jgi:hypothetical protein